MISVPITGLVMLFEDSLLAWRCRYCCFLRWERLDLHQRFLRIDSLVAPPVGVTGVS